MGTYKKASDKYTDLHSSSICLLLVGILGIIYVILDYFKVLPFSFNSNMFYIVMGALFTIFIILGLYTAHTAKKVKNTIADEESTTDSIITWAIENLSAESIDTTLEDLSDSSDEEKYLVRTEKLTEILIDKFNLDDESYINSLIDEIYPELFE